MTATANVGATTITVADPVNWRVGDQIGAFALILRRVRLLAD